MEAISKEIKTDHSWCCREPNLDVVVAFYDTLLTPYVISVASDIEREKSNKLCPEALISA